MAGKDAPPRDVPRDPPRDADGGAVVETEDVQNGGASAISGKGIIDG